MKKSLLITLDFSPNLGGVSAYYYNVCQNIASDKIIVLAPDNNRAEEFDSRQKFVIIRDNLTEVFPSSSRLGMFNRLGAYFSIRRIIKIIKSQKIELLQVGNILPLGTLAWLIKKWNKTPYLLYTHGLDIMYSQKFWRKKILLKLILRGASNVVANSNFTKNELIKLGVKGSKIIIVYPCPNLELVRFEPDELMQFRVKHQLQNKKILLTAGRLVERKGHDQVIRALPEILKTAPSTVYLVAGAGPYLDQLKRLAVDCNVGQALKFLGAVSDHELALCYSVADAFIMPSRQLADGDVEGFGIVYLEANLYGKPVIGGRSGGVPEAVAAGVSGLLVDPLNTKEIAEAGIKLLTDQGYAGILGAQGRSRAQEQFTWSKQLEKLIKILE